jgi:hypothetical protein
MTPIDEFRALMKAATWERAKGTLRELVASWP